MPALSGPPPPTDPIVCTTATGVAQVRSAGKYSHLVDRVVVGHRAANNALRIEYSGVSKDEGPYQATEECPNLGGEWQRIGVSLDSGGDHLRLDAEQMPPGFEPLPASILVRASGGGTIDRLQGHAGPDEFRGGSSSDLLYGFAGDDLLHGGQRDDTMIGGPGDDEIRAADGREDARVVCGKGRDLAIVDREDRPRGCERVKTR
jgi:hypothetical protein